MSQPGYWIIASAVSVKYWVLVQMLKLVPASDQIIVICILLETVDRIGRNGSNKRYK